MANNDALVGLFVTFGTIILYWGLILFGFWYIMRGLIRFVTRTVKREWEDDL